MFIRTHSFFCLLAFWSLLWALRNSFPMVLATCTHCHRFTWFSFVASYEISRYFRHNGPANKAVKQKYAKVPNCKILDSFEKVRRTDQEINHSPARQQAMDWFILMVWFRVDGAVANSNIVNRTLITFFLTRRIMNRLHWSRFVFIFGCMNQIDVLFSCFFVCVPKVFGTKKVKFQSCAVCCCFSFESLPCVSRFFGAR